MKARPITFQDYLTVCSWWQGNDWPMLPLHSLPPTGIMVEGVCSGYLYFTESSWAVLEWVVSNPRVGKEERRAGLDLLIDSLIDLAGDKTIFTTAKHEGLIKRLEKHGFMKSDVGVTHLVHRR